ncbi:putative retroelement [Abeliophyllum distichum]|uniref:Retroelement n=1 Tax=Abeliophyllum distichum TaxID=126358 RepID=A0ABD1V5C7_9LAMI
MGQNAIRVKDVENPHINGNNGPNNGVFIPNIGPNLVRPREMPYVHQPKGFPFDPNAILRDQVIEIMQAQLAFGIRPIIQPMYRKPYPDWVDQAYPWPRGCYQSGRITFESKKKMAVDEYPFPQPVDVNMVILNLDKFGLLRFKLVVDDGEDKPRPSAFERLKGKAVWSVLKPTGKNKVVNQNVLEDKEEENIEELAKESIEKECIGKSRFEHRRKDEDEHDSEQLITIQFGTLLRVMASNYLFANQFKKKKSNDVMKKETTKVACVLECGEGTSNRGQVTHDNSEEEDNGMTNIGRRD